MAEINISLSKKQEHLVFTKTTFDDLGFETSSKRAILAIAPDRDPDEMLAKAQELDWKVFGEPDANGFCKVERIATKEVVQSK